MAYADFDNPYVIYGFLYDSDGNVIENQDIIIHIEVCTGTDECIKKTCFTDNLNIKTDSKGGYFYTFSDDSDSEFVFDETGLACDSFIDIGDRIWITTEGCFDKTYYNISDSSSLFLDKQYLNQCNDGPSHDGSNSGGSGAGGGGISNFPDNYQKEDNDQEQTINKSSDKQEPVEVFDIDIEIDKIEFDKENDVLTIDIDLKKSYDNLLIDFFIYDVNQELISEVVKDHSGRKLRIEKELKDIKSSIYSFVIYVYDSDQNLLATKILDYIIDNEDGKPARLEEPRQMFNWNIVLLIIIVLLVVKFQYSIFMKKR